MDERKKIIEKIKKLLLLADTNKNSNVEEAAAAAGKAQSLMEKHRIEKVLLNLESQVGSHYLSDSGLPSNWKICLIATITKHNGCYVVVSENYTTDNQLLLVGEESDISSVQALYTYLVNELNRLCLTEIISYKEKRNAYPPKTYIESFYLGAIEAIDFRLALVNKQVREAEIKNAKCAKDIENISYALQKLDTRIEDAKNWVSQNMKTKVKDFVVEKSSSDGFKAGIVAASELNLTPNQKTLPDKQK